MTSEWTFEADVDNFSYYSQQLLDMWPQKIALSGAISAVCGFFYADAILLWIWLGAVCADFFFGAVYGITTEGCLSCIKLRKGVAKIVAYLVYILIAGLAGVTLTRATGVPVPLLNLFIAYMTLTEFKSVLKNLELLGWKTPPLIDLIIHKSTSKIEKTVEKTIDSDDQGQDR